MRIYTIGFTKKNASTFFGLLRECGASTLIDIRLNNVSQLSGFTKQHDLQFFVRELCGMSYRHEVRLAPSGDVLSMYKKGLLSWDRFEENYLKLLQVRQVAQSLIPSDFDNSVLLCSEPTPEQCHRRLAVEHFAQSWGDVEIVHL